MGSKNGRSELEFGLNQLTRSLITENAVFNLFIDHIVDRLFGEEAANLLNVEPKNKKMMEYRGGASLPVFLQYIGLFRIYRPTIKK